MRRAVLERNSFSQRILDELGVGESNALEPSRKAARIEDRLLEMQTLLLAQQGQIAQAVQAAACAAEAVMKVASAMAGLQPIPPTQPDHRPIVEQVAKAAQATKAPKKMPDELSKPIQAVNIKFERDVAKVPEAHTAPEEIGG